MSDFSSDEQQKGKELIEKHGQRASRMMNGYAASYYGVSNVGAIIHRCKYADGGDYPDYLLQITLRTFWKKFKQTKFDYVMYVPTTKSGDLVKNFAEKFANSIKVAINDGLVKVRQTSEQKMFQNRYGKQENISGAFAVRGDMRGKRIVLLDDIYDSGETLREIGRILTEKGALNT